VRRILGFLVAGFVGAAILPAVANSAPLGTSPARTGPGLAQLADGVAAEAAHAAPGDVLDVLVTLDQPASPGLAGRLAGLATWSWAAKHIPVAAMGLPVARLGALRSLDGVLGVWPDTTLHYYGDGPVSATTLPAAAGTAASPPAAGPLPVPVPKVIPSDKFGAALPVPGLGVDGTGVTVAIVDSGVDGLHPDLAPAMKANLKMSPLGPDGPLPPIEGLPDTDTSSGHGTHVAGDVAGRGIASNGAYKGSAPGASLVGLGAGEGLSVESRAVLQAYDWIIEHRQQYGIRVINNSFGGSFEPFKPDDPMNKATKAATDAGIVVVFAQGNDGDEMTMNNEATPPWVIAVAAGTQARGLTDFTSGGIDADVVEPTNFSANDLAGDPRRPLRMGLYHPSVVALGEFVVGPRAANTIVPVLGARHDVALPPGQQAFYTIMSGTSMASPEACGIVALVLEANPALKPADVKRVLQVTAKSIPNVPFFRQGYGNLDPAGAVGLARQLLGKTPADVNRILDEQQAARDAAVLAGIDHPLHTTAWSGEKARSGDSDAHKITVEPGTGRLKVVNAGLSLPFTPDPVEMIVVRDASGKEVGRSDLKLPGGSGTEVLDLDLTKMSGLAWGTWTIEVAQAGLVPLGFGSDQATVAATFAKAAKPDPVASILPHNLPKISK
jgi:subtilisin family serine protease